MTAAVISALIDFQYHAESHDVCNVAEMLLGRGISNKLDEINQVVIVRSEQQMTPK